MDARCAPLRVLAAHPSDQITQAPIDLGPPCSPPRFPTPKRREARTMPAKDGLRLNDLCRTQQARPAPGHPDQQGTVTATQPKARRRTPQGDAELVAEEQVLGFKPARRLEEVDDEHCERMQEREHRCNNPSCFAPSSAVTNVIPVTLPPGRLRLATRPSLTGLAPLAKTIGIVVVAALATIDEGVSCAAITVT